MGVSERRTEGQQPAFLKAGPWPGLCFCHSSPAFTDTSAELPGHGSLYRVPAVAAKRVRWPGQCGLWWGGHSAAQHRCSYWYQHRTVLGHLACVFE